MSDILTVSREGAVARVWLNRPEVRNALNGALIRELAAAFAGFGAEGSGVRAIVVGGQGKAFCAGADLAFMREVGGYTWEQNRADAEVWPRCCGRCTAAGPVVARIHGDCYAGGVGIASVCDIGSSPTASTLAQRSPARAAAGDDQPLRRARHGRAAARATS